MLWNFGRSFTLMGKGFVGFLRCMSHTHVIVFGEQQKKDEVYLNLVLEYVPETVYRASRHYAKLKQTMPMPYIRLYMYQLLRSLAYIHCLGEFAVSKSNVKMIEGPAIHRYMPSRYQTSEPSPQSSNRHP